MKIAYLDCFSGISGDMTIAAFLDAGLSIKTLERELAKLKVKGFSIKRSKVMRGCISGTKFDCERKEKVHAHRSLKEIISIIDKSRLNDNVKRAAKGIFSVIGEAEAKVHGIRAGHDVRLHELGDVDSIVDIVGAAIAIDELGIDEVYSSGINLGRTFVRSAHGMLPTPAPAVMEILKGVPVSISEVGAELVTPTGAGILKYLSRSFGKAPEMKVSSVGYGAGTISLEDRPNMLRVMIGEKSKTFSTDRAVVIEANIDDMSPQIFEYLFERLFKEGALDAYTTHIQMKKTRPAFKLTVLAKPADVEKISSVILSETTTIGVRFYEADRFILERKIVRVKTKFGNVDVKISSGPGKSFTASPEYETCVRIARGRKVPLKLVYDEAKKSASKEI